MFGNLNKDVQNTASGFIVSWRNPEENIEQLLACVEGLIICKLQKSFCTLLISVYIKTLVAPTVHTNLVTCHCLSLFPILLHSSFFYGHIPARNKNVTWGNKGWHRKHSQSQKQNNSKWWDQLSWQCKMSYLCRLYLAYVFCLNLA